MGITSILPEMGRELGKEEKGQSEISFTRAMGGKSRKGFRGHQHSCSRKDQPAADHVRKDCGVIGLYTWLRESARRYMCESTPSLLALVTLLCIRRVDSLTYFHHTSREVADPHMISPCNLDMRRICKDGAVRRVLV